MSDKKKILLAMSGGVDSSVAGHLLQTGGYDVRGMFIHFGHGQDDSGCSSRRHAEDAQKMAQKMGFKLDIVNAGDRFAPIMENFISEYEHGRTPNPCVHCNAMIKYRLLIEHADGLGIPLISTGHYARIKKFDDTHAVIRAAARHKDQSYVLCRLDRRWLARIIFPLGEIDDKSTVRNIAKGLGLEVHDKPDSQEICFVSNDDYVSFLQHHSPQTLRGGNIVDHEGKIRGTHDGYARFTIGQRRGVRVAAGIPMYVTHIDPQTAEVRIGPKENVMGSLLKADRMNWHCDVKEQFDAMVQIRYNHRGAPATVTLTSPDSIEVNFHQPVHAITPGQAAVIYKDDRLLGGGWIL